MYYFRCELDNGNKGYVTYDQNTKEYDCNHFTEDEASEFIEYKLIFSK